MLKHFRKFLEPDYKWKQLDITLTDAFEKVKAERMLIFSWLNYLRKKDSTNDKLQQQVQYALGRHEAELESLKNEIKELRADAQRVKISPFPNQVRTKSGLESEPVSEPKSGLNRRGGFVSRIVSMIRPQRKEYVMQKILELAEKGDYTTKQIETVIVREKGLCGRTAFYDYLKELKYKGLLKPWQKSGRKVLKTAQN
ncbi:hypothetical protein HYU12_02445 [Candidatus Woesearchaeota archaeon]|nr:hypothetical protein [Candidatus Woesearchaeota archaeon]